MRTTWNGLLVGLLLCPVVATATETYETVSPATVPSMNRQTLETAQGKIDYLGPSTGLLPPITFTIDGHQINWNLFGGETSDETSEKTAQLKDRQPNFTVSVEELQTLLQRAQPLFDHADATEPWLDFAVVVGQPGQASGFERRLNREQAKTFFGELRQALHNRAARFTLQSFGCALDLLPPGRAIDVTDAVELVVSRFQPDPGTGRYTGAMTVTNRSASTLPAPVSVVLDLSQNAQVVDPDGTTCHVAPVGREYVHAALPHPEGLLPGETVKMPITLQWSEQTPVVFTATALAGPEAR